jgi:hypothetical protein
MAAERARVQGERKVADPKPAVSRSSAERVTHRPYSEHRLLEARSLAMHVVIAQKIQRDRALLKIAVLNLKRWRTRWGDRVPAWHEEWSKIIKRPWAEIAAVMTEASEEGARLRQSSPFAGCLSGAERQRIYKAFRA